MRRALAFLLIVAIATQARAGTIWITGFEHGVPPVGNIGEPDVMIYGIGSTPVQTRDAVRSGGWALNQKANFSRVFLDPLGPSVATIACRVYASFSSTSSANAMIFFSTSAAVLFSITWNGTNLSLAGSAVSGFATTTGTNTVLPHTYNRIDVAYDTQDGGIGKVWVNGVLDIATTHTTNQANVTRFSLAGEGSTEGYHYDDILCQTELTEPPDGRVIARRGIAGSPVDTGFTFSGCAAIEDCWSNTPWDTTTSANSASTTGAVAQTMVVHPVTTVATGYGTTVVASTSTINAVQVQAIAKTSNITGGGQAGNIRYRVNGGAAVDLPITFATIVDRGWPQGGAGFFTDTVANLDHYEIGWAKDASVSARTHTVEDMWLMVDFFTPSVTNAVRHKVRQD